MDKRKLKINAILILLVVFLIVTALMIRFEFNPISYLLGDNEDEPTTEVTLTNYNGVYRYKESLNKTYKLFSGCSLSYYDFYIIVVNNNYYRYKSSCVGTFLLNEGKIDTLEFSHTLEKNIVIKYDGVEYLKTDLINSVVEGNYFTGDNNDVGNLYADTYHILMKESQIPGKEFSLRETSLYSSNSSYLFSLNVSKDKQFSVKLYGNHSVVLYSYTVGNLDDLPLFSGFGTLLSIVEPIEIPSKYNYKFKAIDKSGVVYNLENKFPITVDGDTLTYNDNIYIKYSPSENVFVMLIGKTKNFCEKDSKSNDVAYYVFHIKYDYVTKNFNNPKFIKKVYKNEGCREVEELMEG